MSTRESYSEGLSLGYEYADEDRRQHAGFAAEESDLRAEARQARTDDASESWRAFKLGIVRAYRDATRTLRAGRWGT